MPAMSVPPALVVWQVDAVARALSRTARKGSASAGPDVATGRSSCRGEPNTGAYFPSAPHAALLNSSASTDSAPTTRELASCACRSRPDRPVRGRTSRRVSAGASWGIPALHGQRHEIISTTASDGVLRVNAGYRLAQLSTMLSDRRRRALARNGLPPRSRNGCARTQVRSADLWYGDRCCGPDRSDHDLPASNASRRAWSTARLGQRSSAPFMTGPPHPYTRMAKVLLLGKRRDAGRSARAGRRHPPRLHSTAEPVPAGSSRRSLAGGTTSNCIRLGFSFAAAKAGDSTPCARRIRSDAGMAPGRPTLVRPVDRRRRDDRWTHGIIQASTSEHLNGATAAGSPSGRIGENASSDCANRLPRSRDDGRPKSTASSSRPSTR